MRPYKLKSQERFLNRDELRRLGRELRDTEADGSVKPGAIAAIRLLALGESPPMIGKLPGHTRVRTTARYAHLAEDSVTRVRR